MGTQDLYPRLSLVEQEADDKVRRVLAYTNSLPKRRGRIS